MKPDGGRVSRAHTPAEDRYAAQRCDCGHIFYADDVIGEPCRWDLCECLSHAPVGGPDAARR